MVQLGDRVKDPITGFTGIAIGRTTWLHGCIRITVQSEELKDGKPVDYTFDEPQLQVLKSGKIPSSRPLTGGPRPDAERRTNAQR